MESGISFLFDLSSLELICPVGISQSEHTKKLGHKTQLSSFAGHFNKYKESFKTIKEY